MRIRMREKEGGGVGVRESVRCEDDVARLLAPYSGLLFFLVSFRPFFYEARKKDLQIEIKLERTTPSSDFGY